MEIFAKLFERFLVFVYHCFDRIVIQGYLPLLSRNAHILYFFRNVLGPYPITPQVLAKRTPEYRRWVEGYARNHNIPIQSPKKGVSQEDLVKLNRDYSINQIEYCRNFIFKRHFPIHKIFEQSCEMGLFRLSADKVAKIFGVRVTKRLRGKLYSVLEKLDHGHHVMRIYCKNLVGRMYEKFSTFLRIEVCVNRMKDLRLNKGLDNLECLRQKLVAITDRFAGFEAQSLNVHVDFPLFQKIALPVTSGKTKIAGIKIHDTRMMRLMEVLLRGGTQLNGWRSADIHQAILTTFGLAAGAYTLTQLRYDLRKMKAHGLLERIGRSYCYCLSDQGTKAALMFILFHKRVCGPLANSLFHHRPDEDLKPSSPIETAYYQADRAIQQVLDLLAA